MDNLSWLQRPWLLMALLLFLPVDIVVKGGNADSGGADEADDKLSGLCANQTLELEAAIEAAEKWALRIQDSNGRPGPGVLRHRLTWLGSYEQCVSTRVPPHPAPALPPSSSPPSPALSSHPPGSVSPLDWMPRYCLASVTLLRFEDEVTRIGLCFPEGCSNQDVQTYLEQREGFLQGLDELKLKVKEVRQVVCQPREVPWSSSTLATVVVLCLLGAVVGFATVHQLATTHVHLPPGLLSEYKALLRPRNSLGSSNSSSSSGPNDLANLLRRQSTTFTSASAGAGAGTSSGVGSASLSSSTSSLLSSRSASGVSEYTMLLSRPITPRRLEHSRMMQIMNCFSLKTSMSRLTRPSRQGRLHSRGQGHSRQGQDGGQGQEHGDPEALPCLHGMRVLSMVWVILGQTHYFATKVPTENLKEAWESARGRFFFQPVVSSFLAGDTFLFISGLLACYLTLHRFTAHQNGFNLLHFYGRRLWRVLPVYVMVMVVTLYVVPHVGDGPLWSELTVLTDHCAANWWSNLFFLNNLVHSDRMCMEWTWYLAADMQFYLLSPIFIFLLYYFPAVGVFLCGVGVVMASVLTGFISTYRHLSLPSLNLQQFSSPGYLEGYFIKPYCRAVPYLTGILGGYFLHRTGCRLRGVKILIWIILAISCSSLVCGSMAAANGAAVSQSMASFYFAMSHVVWALGVAWMAVLCCTQNGGPVSTVLSWRGWAPFSRLSLSVYLIHPVVILVFFLTQRTPFFINFFTMGFTFVGNTVFSFASALVIYLGFESPTMALKDFLCRK